MPTTVVWYRADLRVADHAALAFAAERGAVVPVFVWAPDEEAPWEPGGAHRWWLHGSLAAHDARLQAMGSRLVLRPGPSAEALIDAARAAGADAVAWQAAHEPHLAARDAGVARALTEAGLTVRVFAGSLLHDPEALRTGAGDPYRVYSPFRKAFERTVTVPESQPAPDALDSPDAWPDAVDLDTFGLTPEQQDGVDWAAGMRASWTPGEDAAHADLERFATDRLEHYAEWRDAPAADAVSELSPRLHWGELSPRQVWHAVAGGPARDVAKFRSEVLWREFAAHVLHHFPHTDRAPMRAEYAAFPWRDDPDGLEAWRRGRTGFPIVDAAMRQLWHIGWMHNRARLIVASFLAKDLLVTWTEGADWFWDTLVDGDLASNAFGWQWTAGSGADGQPFFRIFNPVLQGQRFDPDGAYIRQWVPELADLPDRWIHRPWEAPAEVLAEAGMRLGETYPEPLVDHAEARDRALAALAAMRDA